MSQSEDISVRLHDAAWRTLTHLEDQIAIVDARAKALLTGGGAGFDEEVARAGAALARALKECSGEIRQLDKHRFRPFKGGKERFEELLKYVRTLNIEQIGLLWAAVNEIREARAA